MILPEIEFRKEGGGFRESGVDEGILIEILTAGCYAPSIKNRQPWRFICITSKNKKDQIYEVAYKEPEIKKSIAVIALCTTNVGYKMPNGFFAHHYDLGMAAVCMGLQAEKNGLAYEINANYSQDLLKRIISVPMKMELGLLLLIGLKDIEATNVQRNRLRAERVFNFNSW